MEAKQSINRTAQSLQELAGGLLPAGVFLHGRIISPFAIFSGRNIVMALKRMMKSARSI
jgi:hypothetical protein